MLTLKEKINKFCENKKNRLYIGLGLIAVTSLMTTGWMKSKKNNAFDVRSNGESIAVVKTVEEAETVFNEIVEKIKVQEGRDVEVHQNIVIEPVNRKKNEIVESDVLENALNEQISYDIKAIEIVINNEVVAVVDNEDIGKEVLKNVALLQLPEGSKVTLLEGEKPLNEAQLRIQDIVQKKVEEVQDAISEAGAEETVEKTIRSLLNIENKESIVEPLVMVKAEAEIFLNTTPIHIAEINEQEEAPIKLEATTTKLKTSKDIHINEVIRVKNTQEPVERVDNATREEVDTDFNQNIILREAFVASEDIMTSEEALDVLLSDTEEVVRYTLENGDNIWDLAIQHGTTMDRILEINPQIVDATRMQIGEEIKIAAPDPILSIITTEVAIFNELIPSEIEYVEDDTLYKDEEKIKVEGNDGLREITVAVDKVNGKEVGRVLLSDKLLKEANTKVIAYGTKEKPKEKPVDTAVGNVSANKSGKFMHPLNGAGRISSQYGNRGGGYHRGIDIAAPQGTPIYASASGTVTYSGFNNGGFGKLIIIDHGNGYQTYYAHNSALYAKVGQKVSKGQSIAAVGSTGNSSGNHIHFEIRINGSPVNPYSYIY
ncbi:MAG: peptidoglycan DD-metalloendopeptidase family protein [Cellulosilyticaceae bacterium]